jgi:hypothetical protein
MVFHPPYAWCCTPLPRDWDYLFGPVAMPSECFKAPSRGEGLAEHR